MIKNKITPSVHLVVETFEHNLMNQPINIK